jgi:NTP pyrophosphatase (non-canonical NTP hydrolase)
MKIKGNFSHFGLTKEDQKMYGPIEPVKQAMLDGCSIGDKLLEGVMFIFTIHDDGGLSVKVRDTEAAYFDQFDSSKFYELALKRARVEDEFDSLDTNSELQYSLVTKNNQYTSNTLYGPIEFVSEGSKHQQPIPNAGLLTFDIYQEIAAETAIYMNGIKERFPEADPEMLDIIEQSYLGLGMGEAGELQGKIKKIIRDKNGIVDNEAKSAIAGELGDVLWYPAMLARFYGIRFGDIAKSNLLKLRSRNNRGTLKGSGDDR